jgi:hypothetical protein
VTEPLPWYESQPALLARVKTDLQARIGGLSFSIRNRCLVADGDFPVHSKDLIIDHYQIELVFPENFPADFPEVTETEERISRENNLHVNPSGSLCLGVPEELGQAVPEPSDIARFLSKAVNDFFRQQVVYAVDKKFLSEHDHGLKGRLNYYGELFPDAAGDARKIRRCIDLLLAHEVSGRTFCPICVTTRLKNCHLEQFKQNRGKIPPKVLENMRREIRSELNEPRRGRKGT